MANLFAQNTANWDAANQWNTVANGSGSYQTPGASDVCMANGKTVTVNISPTVSEVRNDTTGGATTGGSFTLSNGVTLTANCYGGSSNCVTYAGTVGNSANIVGNVYGASSGMVYAAHNSSTGTLNITGNSTGGSGTNSYTINNNSTGTINITGTLTGGSGLGSNGAFNNVSGTIAITGSVVGGSNSGAYGINNSSSGTVTISGNSTGGSLGHGCYVLSTGVTTISGYAIANNYPNESLTAGSNGVYNNSTSNAAVKVGGTKTGTGGFPAVYGRHFFAAGGVQAAYLYDGNAGNAVNLNGVAQSYPNAADVRYGTQYNANSQTGTLRVPAAASVLYGVLVDNTTGTATLAAADIRSAIGLASANLDAQLSGIPSSVWSYVTRTITSGGGGGGITAQQVWEYVSILLPDGAEALLAGIASRLAEQVPTGPVVVLPAPAAGQTIAWVMCYGPNGALEQGVTISIFLTKTTEDGAFDAAAAVLTSDEDGLAQGPIPRGAGHTFKARRGTNGKLYAFAGVDADTLALPTLLGSP